MIDKPSTRTRIEHYCKDEMFVPSWFTFPSLYSYVVEKFPDGSHFVEVGSWKGCSSSYMGVEIHNSAKNIKFDCVDTWNGTVNDPIHDEDTDVQQKTLYEKFLANTQRVKDYINPIRMDSLEAAATYKDNSLDFVFIDADHTYEAVKKDVEAWLPKIKPGGILAGHDYAWCEDVRNAVHDGLGIGKDMIMSDPWNEGCWWITINEENEE